MKSFFSFVRKEFYHVFRDRKTLILLFGMPIVQIVLFGFALTNEIKNAEMVICDLSHDVSTEKIAADFMANKQFKVLEVISDDRKVEEIFLKGKVKLIVIFEPNFHNRLMHGLTPQIQIVADASDPNVANTLTQYTNAIIMAHLQKNMAPQKQTALVNMDTRMIYNPELKSSTTYIPGLIALILLLVSVLMTSVSIVKEKENGNMELLLVSPFKPIYVVLSKALPYFFLSLINLIIILVLSATLLDLQIKGSVILLFAESMVFIISCLALGLLISSFTKNQQTAMVVSLVGMMLPTIIFTGFIFPLENMPLALRIFSHILPSKWYYIIAKSIMVKGLGLFSIWQESLILVGMSIVLIFLSIKQFKQRLS